MNRMEVLDDFVRGPIAGVHTLTPHTWRFEARPQKDRLMRVWFLRFNPGSRSWTYSAHRRLSKRNKRRSVKTSAGMVAYLRGRLLPADIAACLRATISTAPAADFDIPF